MTKEIIVITIHGKDRPGLFAGITETIAEYDIHVLDISQTVIHDNLFLGMMVEIPKESETSPILKDLLYKAHTLGVKLDYTPIELDTYEDWVKVQGKKRHIITVLGREIPSAVYFSIGNVITENMLNIDFITRLSGRISFESKTTRPRACVEFSVRGNPKNETEIKRSFLSISKEYGVDIGYQEDTIFRRNRRLVAFDMDSTLINTEVIDELAKAAGQGEKVAQITEEAMQGKLDFRESLIKRVKYLKGLDIKTLEKIATSLPMTEGAERLIQVLKKLGYKIAILSGGFSYFGNQLKEKFGIDYVYANELEIKDDKLTGNIIGDIVDGQRKSDLLQNIAQKENIDLKQVIAVGDGANDLPMLAIAGLGIAFNAKPVVKAGAKHSISNLGLDAILYLIGLRDRDANL